jgi:diaminopimelate epimerase
MTYGTGAQRRRFCTSAFSESNGQQRYRVIFSKMHGLGNDFIMVDDRERKIPDETLPALSRKVNDRHFGIGGDGLILVRPSKTADFQMRIINSDGSEAEMCGNGIRCFARFIVERGMTGANPVRVDTLAGVMVLDVQRENGEVTGVRVDMGEPRTERPDVPMQGSGPALNVPLCVEGREFEVTGVSMGNPHAVTFVDSLEDFPFEHFGPLIERHEMFPAKTNVHFVEQTGPDDLAVKVWERGAGPTLACGTGACAICVAANLTGRAGRAVTVHLPGGPLQIEWAEDNHLFMTGPAAFVFDGETAPEFEA